MAWTNLAEDLDELFSDLRRDEKELRRITGNPLWYVERVKSPRKPRRPRKVREKKSRPVVFGGGHWGQRVVLTRPTKFKFKRKK